ncbi:MAG TPA: nucleotidyltransferase domain-containing protein [Chloroflexi bacterium]|nr:nucleotidyltransferase domain-containing protein [Chloroflexota bacterium]
MRGRRVENAPEGNRLLERQTLLEQELRRVVEALRGSGAQLIVLFGSAARGEIAPWSDLDIIVVLDSELSFIKRLGWLYERIQPRVGLDLLAYTPQEFEAIRQRPFIRQAMEEGKVLYEARSNP